EGLQKYDPEYILVFLENIVNTYIHNEVLLSDNRVASVAFINKQQLSKPIVKCGDDIIDLSKEDDLHIDAIL
ncbi:MAG: HD-GYP domain-containing protein, partial [Lachnospiraceae bacterium]|nr:HD-GYP domain-containing protein [Lachnospiraceae bacterium]